MALFKADPKDPRLLGKLDEQERYGWCTTGASADSRRCFRRWERLVCYDLLMR